MTEFLTGQTLIKFLILQYIVIAVVFLANKDWNMSVYWIGATILNLAILRMGGV